MKHRATRAKPSLRSQISALHQRISNPNSLLQSNSPHASPPVGAHPDVRLPSSAIKRSAHGTPTPQAAALPKAPLTFEDHLQKIDLFKGKYRESIQQLLAAAYAACIAYDDKSETVKAANKAILEDKSKTLGIEGKSHFQLIVKHALGDDAKRASGFVHVIKAAQNQNPSVEPDDFISWLTAKGGIQAVREKLNSDGTEKTSTTRTPAEVTAENISKAKDSVLNDSLAAFQYGQLPPVAKLGNEGDGLAILHQQADGSMVIKLVLNDSKLVDSIYAALGRTLK